MWLASGRNGTRPDHQFVNRIQNIALYDEAHANYHTYKDIEKLCKRVDIDILELIDTLKDDSTPRIKDGNWTTYKVNDCYIGVRYYKDKQV